MKNKGREVIIGIALVIFCVTIGVTFSVHVYKSNEKTYKTSHELKQQEKSYRTITVAKEYEPTNLVVLNLTEQREQEEKKKAEELERQRLEEEQKKQEEAKRLEEEKRKKEEEEARIRATQIVYDGMTLDELVAKLEKSMKNELSGMGQVYASYSLEKGVDPYLALAITLHETGCNWTCSRLVKECNNVGGQKGGTEKCPGTSYRKFNTLEEGIKGYIDNLKNNYYDYGLTTPEAMNKKYAASTSWADKVNSYIEQIKNK